MASQVATTSTSSKGTVAASACGLHETTNIIECFRCRIELYRAELERCGPACHGEVARRPKDIQDDKTFEGISPIISTSSANTMFCLCGTECFRRQINEHIAELERCGSVCHCTLGTATRLIHIADEKITLGSYTWYGRDCFITGKFRWEWLLDWQRNIVNHCLTEANSSRVWWIYDEIGCSGRTMLVKYMNANYPEKCITVFNPEEGSTTDVITTMIKSKGRSNIVIIEYTRSAINHDTIYGMLKILTSGAINVAHIIVLSSQAPKVNLEGKIRSVQLVWKEERYNKSRESAHSRSRYFKWRNELLMSGHIPSGNVIDMVLKKGD